ncbi:MAG: hypothetical protein GVY13_02190 [Alphaproteobacteria bacterium]|nr:hypothetical protein [Alphaproteobacteria bacterium]
MTEHFGLILDSLVIILLMATIFYAAVLSRRLSQLRRHRKDLDGAIRSLAEAAARADNGIKGLKHTAEETGNRLQSQIDRANALRDELALLVDSGDALAERLGAAEHPVAPRRNGAAANDAAPAHALTAGVPGDEEAGAEGEAALPRRKAHAGKSGVIPASTKENGRRSARDMRGDGPDDDLMKVIDNMR